jgi:hypothetical protein
MLNKSLYGLKQAPRIWFLLLCMAIHSLGFQSCASDSSIYFSAQRQVFLAVNVDDILVFGKDKNSCDSVYNELSQYFRMQPSVLQLRSSDFTLFVPQCQRSQSTKAVTSNGCSFGSTVVLQKHHSIRLYLSSKPRATTNEPMQLNTKRSPDHSTHLAVFSRPDIAFAVGKLCSFNSDPTVTHMKAARHVLRYLLHTKHFTITYGGAPNLTPLVYVDADWVSNPNDHKSTTGYLVLINGGAVAWISHKQQSVAISTMESEYMALSDASREAIARSQFFDDLNILIGTPLLFCDNQAALTLAQRPIRYHRSKHINIRYHFIRDCLENDQIVINYIPMENQLADVLTKALPPLRHQRCITE